MNLQLHHVLSDITGTSGQAILDAILSGRRDPVELARLCHRRVKSPRDKVAQALVGDYRPEHLFTLKQSLQGCRYYQKLILELDQETARLMQALPSAAEDPIPPRTKPTAYQRQGNDPRFDLRGELYRIAGVISPTFLELVQPPHKSSLPRLAGMSVTSATPPRSPHGLASARKNESAAARCCLVKPAR